jgi:hypothetical protein
VLFNNAVNCYVYIVSDGKRRGKNEKPHKFLSVLFNNAVNCYVYIVSEIDEGACNNSGNDTDTKNRSTQVKARPNAPFHHKSQVDWPVTEWWSLH